MVYSLTLPLPPASGSSMHFNEQVHLAVRLAKFPQIDGKINLVARFHPRDKRPINEHRMKRTLVDALQHSGVYEDDSQIDHLEVKRGHVTPGGLCEVTIGVIDA